MADDARNSSILPAEAIALAKLAAMMGGDAVAKQSGTILDRGVVEEIAEKAVADALKAFGLDPGKVDDFRDTIAFATRWKTGMRDAWGRVIQGLLTAAAIGAAAILLKYGGKS